MSDVDSTRRSELVAELYAQHGEKLRAFLHGLLRDGDLAAEALQNTFRQAVRALPAPLTDATLEGARGWMFRVAYHEAMLIRRKAKVAGKVLQKVADESGSELPVPDDPLIRRETIGRVREALKELPPDQRHVVEQRIYGEKTFAVIASELNVPLGTVLTRNRLALEKLRAALSEQHE